MAPPGNLDALSPTELKALVLELLGKVAAQRAEIAQLKGLKGRPALKPSGMEEASEPKPPSPPRGRRGPVAPRVAVEDRILATAAPPGSRFKGYADFVVQDMELRTKMRPWGRDSGQRGGTTRDRRLAATRLIMAARRWFHADWQGRERQPRPEDQRSSRPGVVVSRPASSADRYPHFS